MELSPIEVRILGALIEKEATTPDVYPLSLNALTNACNQTSNRDPVMELEEDAVRWAINSLRQHSLVRAIQRADSRVMKYEHLMREKLNVDGPELAVMAVLMLRGPQTGGEIKGRTNRLHEFRELGEVEATLAGLIQRGLVAELPRRPGQKEARYGQLLSGAAATHVDESSDESAPAALTIAHTVDVREERIVTLEATVQELRRELSELQSSFEDFKRQFG